MFYTETIVWIFINFISRQKEGNLLEVVGGSEIKGNYNELVDQSNGTRHFTFGYQ